MAKRYKKFKAWRTDMDLKVEDCLNEGGRAIVLTSNTCPCWMTLTPTDIKRLMACVERWEESRRPQTEISDAGVFCKAAV